MSWKNALCYKILYYIKGYSHQNYVHQMELFLTNQRRTECALIRLNMMCLVMRKPVFALCEQQRCWSACTSASLISTFVVRCLDSIIPLVSISEISRLYLASVAVQAALSLTWSKTAKKGFLVSDEALIVSVKNVVALFHSGKAVFICLGSIAVKFKKFRHPNNAVIILEFEQCGCTLKQCR